MQISSICPSYFNSLANRIHKLKWGIQRKDLTLFFSPPLVFFYLQASIPWWEAGSCLWEDEQCLWVFSIPFFAIRANTFFGYLGLCFRKQVHLLVLWFAQAPTCTTSKQATEFISISSRAYLVNDATPSLTLLAHMEGMMVLFFLSPCFGDKYPHYVLLPASPWLYHKLLPKMTQTPDLGSTAAFQSWPSFCPAVFSFAQSTPSGYGLEGSIQTRTEFKLVSWKQIRKMACHNLCGIIFHWRFIDWDIRNLLS